MIKHHVAAAAIALAALTATEVARAGGLYVADRGVRPLGRGGAFIAGADDLGAIAYNPAGIFDAGGQVLFDGAWVNFGSDYTRQALLTQIDPNTGQPVGQVTQTFDKVSGSTPFLPIPTIAASFKPHRQWVLAFGAYAPYAALSSYPETVNGKPAPQRYSLLTLDGSLLAIVGATVAYSPAKEWRFGASFNLLVGKFQTTKVLSGCVPEEFFCAPEDPNWDVLSQISVGPIVAPTGQLGAIWVPHPSWRVGLTVKLPIYVRAPAKLKVRLPSTPVFERASVEGEDADVAFDLPWSIHTGVETRAVENLRLELAASYERWGMHDSIRLTPNGIGLKNVVGFPETYLVPPINLVRRFQDTFSVKVGGEYAIAVKNVTIVPRAGVSFESSAIPKEYLTVLTLDANKVTASVGASVHIGKWRLDAVYAHVFGLGVTVDPKDAKITQESPVIANPSKTPSYVNGGIYGMRADIVGLGLAYTFDTGMGNDPPAPAKPGK